jgi:hypothetical protein
MEITLGYLKDAIAFTSVVLFIIFVSIFKIELTPQIIKYLFYAILILILFFDGFFSFIPWLHNYPVKKIVGDS